MHQWRLLLACQPCYAPRLSAFFLLLDLQPLKEHSSSGIKCHGLLPLVPAATPPPPVFCKGRHTPQAIEVQVTLARKWNTTCRLMLQPIGVTEQMLERGLNAKKTSRKIKTSQATKQEGANHVPGHTAR